MATSTIFLHIYLQHSFIDSFFTTPFIFIIELIIPEPTTPPLHSQNTHKNIVLMAAETLMAAMDTLWFHQIILFPEPTPFHLPQLHKKPAQSSDYSSKNISSVAFQYPQDDTGSQESDHHTETRSHSSSPKKRSRNTPRLQKTMSCKTLLDLELEELKGFMDLGFSFRKENLSRHIVDLIPGLQRIGDSCNNDDEDEDEEEKGVMRPYLSESWIIKRPDSPLLNWRMPRVSTAADMKKHLKFWAQTVASAIHQESL